SRGPSANGPSRATRRAGLAALGKRGRAPRRPRGRAWLPVPRGTFGRRGGYGQRTLPTRAGRAAVGALGDAVEDQANLLEQEPPGGDPVVVGSDSRAGTERHHRNGISIAPRWIWTQPSVEVQVAASCDCSRRRS